MGDLLGIFLIALASQFVTPFLSILNVLISFFCYRMHIFSSARLERLDNLFSNHGWSQMRNMEPGKYPAEGYNLMWNMGGLLIGRKYSIRSERGGSETFYELFIFGSTLYAWLDGELRGASDTITVQLCNTPTIWRLETYTIPHPMKHQPYTWQLDILNDIMARFKQHTHVSVLLWGEAGVGKSEIAYLLNKRLKDESVFEMDPITVEADITKKGLCLSDLCVNPPKERPIILLFNEFDATILYAQEEKDAKSDGMSLAGTKTSLLNTLDQINRLPNVILIATMNVDPETIPLVYRRPGRFDIIIQMEKK